MNDSPAACERCTATDPSVRTVKIQYETWCLCASCKRRLVTDRIHCLRADLADLERELDGE